MPIVDGIDYLDLGVVVRVRVSVRVRVRVRVRVASTTWISA